MIERRLGAFPDAFSGGVMHGKSNDPFAYPLGDTRPEIWVIGNDAAAVAAAEACGLRVSRHLSADDAVAAVQSRQGVSLIIVAVDHAMSNDVEDILDLLDRQAHDSRTAVIVSCSPPMLDTVVAWVSAPYATLLCDPSPIDWIMAISATMQDTTYVAETDPTADARHLLQLTDEVARIARAIAGLSKDAPSISYKVSDGLVGYRSAPSTPVQDDITAGDVRTMIKWRRRREELFADEFFADPAWDMILDLVAARIEGNEVAVSSLCIAAAVPATTALRWIKTLTDAGMLERVADPNDRRRIHIRLADAVATTMSRFLGEAKSAGTALI